MSENKYILRLINFISIYIFTSIYVTNVISLMKTTEWGASRFQLEVYITTEGSQVESHRSLKTTN